jgi:hypothetical protein
VKCTWENNISLAPQIQNQNKYCSSLKKKGPHSGKKILYNQGPTLPSDLFGRGVFVGIPTKAHLIQSLNHTAQDSSLDLVGRDRCMDWCMTANQQTLAKIQFLGEMSLGSTCT